MHIHYAEVFQKVICQFLLWIASHTKFSLEADFTKKHTVHKAADYTSNFNNFKLDCKSNVIYYTFIPLY